MAYPSFISASAYAASTNSTTVTVTYQTNLADDILILVVSTDANASTINTPAGWTEMGAQVSMTDYGAKAFWRRITTPLTGTFSVTQSAGGGTGRQFGAIIYLFRGAIATGTPFEGYASLSGSNTASDAIAEAPNLTTSGSERLGVLIGTYGDDIPGTGSSGWTERSDLGNATGNDGEKVVYTQNIATATTLSGNTITYTAVANPWVNFVFAFIPLPVATFSQTNYRFRNDDGTESTATWKAGLNTPITVPLDTIFRLRIEMTETAGVAATNQPFEFWFSVNGGTWTQQSFFTNYEIRPDLSQLVDGSNTTQQIGSGTYIASNAGQIESIRDYSIEGEGLVSFTANSKVELEYSLKLFSADGASNGDFYDIKIYKYPSTLLSAYAQIPRVTAGTAGVTIDGTSLPANAKGIVSADVIQLSSLILTGTTSAKGIVSADAVHSGSLILTGTSSAKGLISADSVRLGSLVLTGTTTAIASVTGTALQNSLTLTDQVSAKAIAEGSVLITGGGIVVSGETVATASVTGSGLMGNLTLSGNSTRVGSVSGSVILGSVVITDSATAKALITGSALQSSLILSGQSTAKALLDGLAYSGSLARSGISNSSASVTGSTTLSSIVIQGEASAHATITGSLILDGLVITGEASANVSITGNVILGSITVADSVSAIASTSGDLIITGGGLTLTGEAVSTATVTGNVMLSSLILTGESTASASISGLGLATSVVLTGESFSVADVSGLSVLGNLSVSGEVLAIASVDGNVLIIGSEIATGQANSIAYIDGFIIITSTLLPDDDRVYFVSSQDRIYRSPVRNRSYAPYPREITYLQPEEIRIYTPPARHRVYVIED